MKKGNIIIFFLVTGFIFMSNIALAINYYSFLYKVEEGETFGIILKKFVKDDAVINFKTPLVQKIIKKNPHVKSWENIPPGTLIDVYISDDYMDMGKFRPYQVATEQKIAEEEKSLNTKKNLTGLKGSVFYMASLGMFDQKSSDVAEITFKQNSPVSLGTSLNYYVPEKLYSFAFGGYVSYLRASENTLTSEEVSIKPEVGLNGYSEYRWQKYNTTLYAGLDYEKFSAFNMIGIRDDRKIYVDEIGVGYLTFGFSRAFLLFKKQFFTKVSISKTFLSDYSSGAPSTLDTSNSAEHKYSGYKAMFYLNYKLNSKYFLHSMIKYHAMSGPSELSTLRVGMGFGYILGI